MIDLQCKVGGFFKMEAFKKDAEGQVIEESRRVVADWFPNLITNYGLNLMGSTGGYLFYCQVGQGTATPAFTDEMLDVVAGVYYGGSTISAQGTAPYYGYILMYYQFSAGAAAGNLSEIGVAPTALGQAFSRALILDGGGSPTTITILADEYLNVTYQMRIYPPLVDATGTVVIAGVTYTWVTRAAAVTSGSNGGWYIPTGGASMGSTAGSYNYCSVTNGSLGAITANPTGTGAAYASNTDNAYSNGSYTRTCSYYMGLGNGNVAGGITAVTFIMAMGRFQCSFSPAIPKDSTKVLTLGYSITWARY